jgi:hypothetical protein
VLPRRYPSLNKVFRRSIIFLFLLRVATCICLSVRSMEGRRLSRQQLRSLPDAASFSPEVAASPGLVGSGQLGLGLSAAFETLPPVPISSLPRPQGRSWLPPPRPRRRAGGHPPRPGGLACSSDAHLFFPVAFSVNPKQIRPLSSIKSFFQLDQHLDLGSGTIVIGSGTIVRLRPRCLR